MMKRTTGVWACVEFVSGVALLVGGLVALVMGLHLAIGAVQTGKQQQTTATFVAGQRLEQIKGTHQDREQLDVGHTVGVVGDSSRAMAVTERYTSRSTVRRPHAALAALALIAALKAGEFERRETYKGAMPRNR